MSNYFSCFFVSINPFIIKKIVRVMWIDNMCYCIAIKSILKMCEKQKQLVIISKLISVNKKAAYLK